MVTGIIRFHDSHSIIYGIDMLCLVMSMLLIAGAGATQVRSIVNFAFSHLPTTSNHVLHQIEQSHTVDFRCIPA